MARKPRADSTLDSLAAPQKEALRGWLVEESLSYAKAKARLAKEFGVQSSIGALCRFYSRECFMLRSSSAKQFAEDIIREMQSSGGDQLFDNATLALVKQKAFERAYARHGDVDELAALAKIVGDSAKLKLKQRELDISQETLALKVKVYEDKIAAARASLEKAKSKGGLEPSTLQLIEEQLKLL